MRASSREDNISISQDPIPACLDQEHMCCYRKLNNNNNKKITVIVIALSYRQATEIIWNLLNNSS